MDYNLNKVFPIFLYQFFFNYPPQSYTHHTHLSAHLLRLHLSYPPPSSTYLTHHPPPPILPPPPPTNLPTLPYLPYLPLYTPTLPLPHPIDTLQVGGGGGGVKLCRGVEGVCVYVCVCVWVVRGSRVYGIFTCVYGKSK